LYIRSMKAATVNELKQELQHLPASKLVELCLRLARFKKENKELLTFLLFEAHDIPGYIKAVQQEVDAGFEAMNTGNVYFMKKTLRKVLRIANKFIRYSGLDMVEVEVLLYYCEQVKRLDKKVFTSPVVTNLYQNQLKKIGKTLATMHEDLQYDYLKTYEALKH
jgi:hypothetical protein